MLSAHWPLPRRAPPCPLAPPPSGSSLPAGPSSVGLLPAHPPVSSRVVLPTPIRLLSRSGSSPAAGCPLSIPVSSACGLGGPGDSLSVLNLTALLDHSAPAAGMNRTLPVRERSRTEEDILRAALKGSSGRTASHPASTSDDSNGLEWESDFVGADLDANGNAELPGRGDAAWEPPALA